jgi:hypothetical protein
MDDTQMTEAPPASFGPEEMQKMLSQFLKETTEAVREELRRQVVHASPGMNSDQGSAARTMGVGADALWSVR